MSLETAQKVIVTQKKNYVPQFLKQRDINSYFVSMLGISIIVSFRIVGSKRQQQREVPIWHQKRNKNVPRNGA
jgi:hypothetical protein